MNIRISEVDKRQRYVTDFLVGRAEANNNRFLIVYENGNRLTKEGRASLAVYLNSEFRKRGYNPDDILFVTKENGVDVRMRVIDKEGVEGDMCGNGIRCIAKWANENLGYLNPRTIHTKAGKKVVDYLGNGIFRVSMGKPVLDFGTQSMQINVGKNSYNVYFVNTGEPHAVIPVNKLSEIDVDTVGSAIGNDRKFANYGKSNVTFMQVLDDGTIWTRFWERGCERETESCGTGSTAAAVVAIKNKFVKSNLISVMSKGGTLSVSYENNGGYKLVGGATVSPPSDVIYVEGNKRNPLQPHYLTGSAISFATGQRVMMVRKDDIGPSGAFSFEEINGIIRSSIRDKILPNDAHALIASLENGHGIVGISNVTHSAIGFVTIEKLLGDGLKTVLGLDSRMPHIYNIKQYSAEGFEGSLESMVGLFLGRFSLLMKSGHAVFLGQTRDVSAINAVKRFAVEEGLAIRIENPANMPMLGALMYNGSDLKNYTAALKFVNSRAYTMNAVITSMNAKPVVTGIKNPDITVPITYMLCPDNCNKVESILRGAYSRGDSDHVQLFVNDLVAHGYKALLRKEEADDTLPAQDMHI
jgi:diaminopimelate epimerase